MVHFADTTFAARRTTVRPTCPNLVRHCVFSFHVRNRALKSFGQCGMDVDCVADHGVRRTGIHQCDVDMNELCGIRGQHSRAQIKFLPASMMTLIMPAVSPIS